MSNSGTGLPFDPDSFMQQNVDAPMATSVRLIPEKEYPAMIGDFTSEAFQQIDFTYKKGKRAGQPGTMTKFSIPFILQDEAVKADLGREELVVYCELNLDIDPATGALDFGPDKNVRLGQLRQAVGQNAAGPWSPASLKGAGPLMVAVKHETVYKGEPNEFKRATVARFVKLAN